MSKDSAVTRLKRIGFEAVAVWGMSDRGMDYSLLGDAQQQERDAQQQERMKALLAVNNALYAFCCGDDVLYIGKTADGLKNRLGGYRRPGPTQGTNRKCHNSIKEAIRKDPRTMIKIFAFVPQEGMLAYHGFPINLPAGLEDILISRFAPPWNGRGTGAAILT
jgi:hypothetical protein